MSTLPIASRTAPIWPDRTLVPASERAGGWRPTPFRDVILKIHQHCNLACDYCYVYTMEDQSWRDKPPRMQRSTWLATAARMAEHAATHQLTRMRLVLHGGEPLLAGPMRLAELISDFRSAFRGQCGLDIQVQTNGVLLTKRMLDLFIDHGVGVGVSLDGTGSANDRRRRRPDGRGSSAAVDRALRLMATDQYEQLFAGLLCIVDPATDPIECYEALISYRPPRMDLLLPHANWESPPPHTRPDNRTPYADWLLRIFDRWYDAPRRETVIRLFEDLMVLALGGAGRSEQVGLSPVAVVVVETDGSLEQVDSLKSAYAGACATGLSVFADPFDAAFDHPGIVARQLGAMALCDTCSTCQVSEICGGGHYAHRYRHPDGFRNPSVYCDDMFKLVRHVRGRVLADLQRTLTEKSSRCSTTG